jgi:hypothetical protein
MKILQLLLGLSFISQCVAQDNEGVWSPRPFDESVLNQMKEAGRNSVKNHYVVGLFQPLTLAFLLSGDAEYDAWSRNPLNYQNLPNRLFYARTFQSVTVLSEKGSSRFINVRVLGSGIGVRYTFSGGESPLYLLILKQDDQHEGADLYLLPERHDSVYAVNAPPLENYSLPVRLKHYYRQKEFDTITEAIKAGIQDAKEKNEPNQTPEPTPTAVTPDADASVAPSAGAAHL